MSFRKVCQRAACFDKLADVSCQGLDLFYLPGLKMQACVLGALYMLGFEDLRFKSWGSVLIAGIEAIHPSHVLST